MFKVGDKVVYKPIMVQGVIFDVVGFDDFGWVQVEGKLEGLDMPKRYSEEPPFQDIRLATLGEIAAGHRIEQVK